MKKLMLIGLLLITASASAAIVKEPQQLNAGTYVGSSAVLLDQEVQEAVDTRNEIGKARLQYLLSEKKATCRVITGTTQQCVWKDDAALPTEVINDLVDEFAGKQLQIGAWGGAALINEGASIEEWQVEQTVSWDGKTWMNYRWIRIPGLEKIALGYGRDGVYFNIGERGELRMPYFLNKPEGARASRKYFFEILFQ